MISAPEKIMISVF